MKELLQKAFAAPRGSMAQNAAIEEIADKFNEQSEQLKAIEAVVLPKSEGEQ